VLRVLLGVLVLLELFALFFAISVISRGPSGVEYLALVVAVGTPAMGLFAVNRIYQRVKASESSR
jgi:hypothetical protein